MPRGNRVGEENTNAKLSNADVQAIRKMKQDGASTGEIGKIFGITRSWAWKIASGKGLEKVPAPELPILSLLSTPLTTSKGRGNAARARWIKRKMEDPDYAEKRRQKNTEAKRRERERRAKEINAVVRAYRAENKEKIHAYRAKRWLKIKSDPVLLAEVHKKRSEWWAKRANKQELKEAA